MGKVQKNVLCEQNKDLYAGVAHAAHKVIL
jgi:hypothetical protein